MYIIGMRVLDLAFLDRILCTGQGTYGLRTHPAGYTRREGERGREGGREGAGATETDRQTEGRRERAGERKRARESARLRQRGGGDMQRQSEKRGGGTPGNVYSGR